MAGYIPPPSGAVMGGQPDMFAAFPGHRPEGGHGHGGQQGQQQWPAPGTPWAHTPGAVAGPSWGNTPAPAPHSAPPGWGTPVGWGQAPPQQYTPAAGWGTMPRQGWGPAPGTGGHPYSGPPTPWDPWGQTHMQPGSAPAANGGFSALAAPESMSGQPIAPGHFGMPHAHAHPPHAHPQAQAHGARMSVYDPRENGWDMIDDDDDELDAVHDAWAREGRGVHTPHPHAPGHVLPGWGAQDPAAVAGWGAPEPAAVGGWGANAWAEDLRRAHSQNQRPPKSPKRQRANSFGGVGAAWAGAMHTYDAHHLSKRPDDWREGYSPRGGSIGVGDLSLASLFRVGKKSNVAVSEGADPKKRTLALPLTYNPTKPPITYDMRTPPDATVHMGAFKPRTPTSMLQPAATPFASRMLLAHPRLPWYVDVIASGTHKPYVTLYDVLSALYAELNRPIAARDFWNVEIKEGDQKQLTKAFKDRCKRFGEFAEAEKLKGVKRVDFLGSEYLFVGLVKRNGMWEMKTITEYAS